MTGVASGRLPALPAVRCALAVVVTDVRLASAMLVLAVSTDSTLLFRKMVSAVFWTSSRFF